MYDVGVRSLALERISAGDSLRSISIATGINRATLREWRERTGAYAARVIACPCPSWTARCYRSQRTAHTCKHTRPIVLEPWQLELIHQDPRPLIRGLIFSDALDLLGIAWRQSNLRNISIARREAVAALDEFVGPKR